MAKKTWKTFLRDDSGATAIEYGLIAAGIAVAILFAVNILGTKVYIAVAKVRNHMR